MASTADYRRHCFWMPSKRSFNIHLYFYRFPFLVEVSFLKRYPTSFIPFLFFFFMGIIFLFKWPREEKCSRFTGFLWFGFYLRWSIAPLPHGNLSQFSLSIVVLILYLLLGLVARRDQMSFSGCVLPRIVGRQMSRVCHRAAMVV